MDRRSFLGLLAVAPFAVKVGVLENAIPKILPFDEHLTGVIPSLYGIEYHHSELTGTWLGLDRSHYPAVRENTVRYSLAYDELVRWCESPQRGGNAVYECAKREYRQFLKDFRQYADSALAI